jgi:carbonic anhydrase
MSNASSPIDITNNYDSICDLKCKYSFNYPLSNLILTNTGEYLSIIPESFNNPPVSYNSNKYNVTEIRLYQKSLHTYAGNNADAELLIIHNNVVGSDILIVSVPIMVGVANPKSSDIFDTIISEFAKTANSVGTQTTLNNVSFTLGQLVPMKPYFSYNGSLPFPPFDGIMTYVVFNIDNAISMSGQAFQSFSNIIVQSSSPISPVQNGLYFNATGPTYYSPSGSSDEIYIECLPTGSSGEVLIQKDKGDQTSFNSSGSSLSNIFNNKIFQGALVAFIIMLGLYFFKMGVNSFLSKKSAKSGGGTGASTNVFKNIFKNASKNAHSTGGNNMIIPSSVGGVKLFKK